MKAKAWERNKFNETLNALLRPNVRAGTIQDAKALGNLWKAHVNQPGWAVESLAKTHDWWAKASDGARAELVTQLMSQPEDFQKKVAPRALDCLFPATPQASRVCNLMWGVKNNQTSAGKWTASDLWPHVQDWLTSRDLATGPLMQALGPQLAWSAITATGKRDYRLLDGLLDVAPALPDPTAVHRALWDCWNDAAMSHNTYSALGKALDRLVSAGMDVNAPTKQGKHAFTHLCVRLRENYPNMVQRSNRKGAILALLDHGAHWQDVDLSKLEDEVRVVFENHPWVTRGRLEDVAQSQKEETLNTGLRPARRI